jgi:hypothetical protein
MTKLHDLTEPVLRIRDVYPRSVDPGCLSRIPDPTFSHPRSRIRTFSIPDPGSASKNLSIFLSSRKYDSGCSSRILDPDADFLPIPDPGVKKAPDPGSGSATLLNTYLCDFHLRRKWRLTTYLCDFHLRRRWRPTTLRRRTCWVTWGGLSPSFTPRTGSPPTASSTPSTSSSQSPRLR